MQRQRGKALSAMGQYMRSGSITYNIYIYHKYLYIILYIYIHQMNLYIYILNRYYIIIYIYTRINDKSEDDKGISPGVLCVQGDIHAESIFGNW